MSADVLFNICNSIALAGWIILIFCPFWFHADKFVLGVLITLLAIVYVWLLTQWFSFSVIGKFGSLQEVTKLFRDPVLVTTGWIHYLAFDLLAGIFIKRNSVKHNISHWLIIPCLLLTFMFGPAGLLLYLLIRWVATKKYFASNF